jgi:Reverse transcriptase (RNA-dependent DNA polymerase)
LSASSIALELLMKDQIMPFVFRNLVSALLALLTTTALLNVTDDLLWNTLLSSFNFDPTAVSLIRFYLSDRLKCVSVGDELSSLVPVQKAVVQGSILDSILFSLFINDLMNLIMFSQCLMYADDVYISGERSDIARTVEKLNANVESIWNWSLLNGLYFNPEKSQSITISVQPFSTTNIPPVVLNGSVVPYCVNVNDLGLFLKKGFTWRDQVNATIQKNYVSGLVPISYL